MGEIFGAIVVLGIVAATAGGLFYAFTSGTDPFTSSTSLDVRNLNALHDDDRLSITATLKNSGQTAVTSVYIDSITVSGITIDQDITGGNEDGEVDINGVHNATALIRSIGFSTDAAGTGSVIEGGRTVAFSLDLQDADLAPITISDSLNLVLRFYAGDDVLLTDVYTTRVKPG